jgi:hypothetical protein
MTTKTMLLSGLVVFLLIGASIIMRKQGDTKQEPSLIKSTPPVRTSSPETIKTTIVTSQPVLQTGAVSIVKTLAPNIETLKFKLPGAVFSGTPKDVRQENLEPARDGKLRDPIHVPVGTKLLSKECKVTSSVANPISGELSYITDGDKDHDITTFVELAPNIQWIQLDLGKEKEIFAACVWHFHGEPRIYNDVICQVSNDPDFIDDVKTVFNNDHDNSSSLGKGTDKEYFETNEGRPFPVNGLKGRYVRFYSRGNTSNEMNHYTEVEIYGKDI